MIQELRLAKKYLGARYGIGATIKDGSYAVPIDTSKGKAFMKVVIEGEGIRGFDLFWDEQLTISWHDSPKPKNIKESLYSKAFRDLIRNELS